MGSSRRRRPHLAAVGLLLALPLCAPARSADLAAGAVLDRVESWLAETRDLEGRFEQTLLSGALGSGPTESGRFYVLRPGRVRWDYLEPERKVALVDGGESRLWVEEDRQLWEWRLEERDGFLPSLLTSDAAVGELFEPALLATPRSGGDGAYRLLLIPRAGGDTLEEVSVTVRPPKFAIERIEVLDAAGNRTLYRFRDLRRNRGLPPATFHFEPPPGTEIMAQP